jgi:hypothetical protein
MAAIANTRTGVRVGAVMVGLFSVNNGTRKSIPYIPIENCNIGETTT